MTPIDRWLQRWRFGKVRPYLRPASRVLDVGSADGALYRYHPAVGGFVGVDPAAAPGPIGPNARLLQGTFPAALDSADRFDVIALLAVLEHVPADVQPAFAAACARYLAPGGVLVVTVPSPIVDRILDLLITLRLVHGMSVEQHYGFDAHQTPALFTGAGLELAVNRRFQLGVNNLFVFRKPPAAAR